jgi:hypothetical protein
MYQTTPGNHLQWGSAIQTSSASPARGPCAAGVCCCKKIPVPVDWRCRQGLQLIVSCELAQALTVCLRIGYPQPHESCRGILTCSQPGDCCRE